MKYLKLFFLIVVVGGIFIFIFYKQNKQKSISKKNIYLNSEWKYADFSVIHSGFAILYSSSSFSKKNIVVAINAGHGTLGGEDKKTYCHPDKTPKVTGGSTAINSLQATAISKGTTFFDGTSEAEVNLMVAKLLKEKLLNAGYDVLMIRDKDDVQLDNVARTVISNNIADIHISIHFDDSANDNGAFYISVPENDDYRSMEPVSSNWIEHERLGNALIFGLKKAKVKISDNISLPIDLTQTSFSTIPSVDIELGDKKSDISKSALMKYANGLFFGILQYFQE